MNGKEYLVERAAADVDGVPAEHASILEALEVGETVTTAALYDRIGDRLSESSTREARMARLRRAMAAAVRAGIARDVTDRSSRPYDDFLKIQCVAEWISMLNAPNTIHTKSRWGGTRSNYGYGLYRFNEWAGGKTVSMTTRVVDASGAQKEVRRDVVVRGVDHLLELALEAGGLNRGIAIFIRQFFAELNEAKKYSRSVMMQTDTAIKSFFTSHDIQYGLRIPRNMLRGTGSGGGGEEWENRDLRLSEFARMLAVGKPTIRDKAVLLSKFHRGLDLSTLADRFNYTAFDQLAHHMGADDPANWDLDKCPVPITLTRVKTDYKHTGFLERDAVQAIIDWIAERERLTGKALRRGDGEVLYINQFGAPISASWVGERFRVLAVRVGLCKERQGGGLSSTRHSHQLRHLLKSTLIDAGCRIDVADHSIGHAPRDAYEKQAVLYPESLRREYAKAAAKINIFSNFETSIDGSDDIHRLRAEVEADRKKLQEALAAAEAGKGRNAAGDAGIIPGPVAEMLAALQNDVRRLQGERDAAQAAAAAPGGGGADGEYQCIPCSLVHSLPACPACGSAERRMYAGRGGGK